MHLFGRIATALFIGAAIAAIAFVFYFVFLFTGTTHLTGLIIAIGVSLWIWYLYLAFGFSAKRNGKKILITIVAFVLVIGASFAVPYYYKESFAKIEAAEVDLYLYEPFTESSELAKLDHEASFRMQHPYLALDGATALYPLYASFTEAVYPEGVYNPYDGSDVISSTTPEAYDRLIHGETDIIFAAGPSEGHLKQAAEAGVELKMTPIGREAFVFFVNTKNDIDGLSSEEIRSIYSGETKNWSEVGGKNDDIRAFQRPEDSGSQTTFIKFMGETPIAQPETEEVASGMGGIIEEVSSYRNHKNAIGYTFRFYANEMVQNDKIKLLAVDGVEPNIDTIRSGEYPMASEFYAITAGSDNPNIEPFLEWILSGEGQQLVEETGFVSVER